MIYQQLMMNTSTLLTNIPKILQKHIDINDTKLTNFIYKYYLIKNHLVELGKLF